jgi:hypothetical protein
MGGRTRLRPPWQYDRFSSYCPSWRGATHVAPIQKNTRPQEGFAGRDVCAEDNLRCRHACLGLFVGKQRALLYGTGSPPNDRQNPCVGVSVCVPQCPISPATSAANDVVRLAMLHLTGRDPGTAMGGPIEIICRLFSQSATSSSQGDPRTRIAALLASV